MAAKLFAQQPQPYTTRQTGIQIYQYTTNSCRISHYNRIRSISNYVYKIIRKASRQAYKRAITATKQRRQETHDRTWQPVRSGHRNSSSSGDSSTGPSVADVDVGSSGGHTAVVVLARHEHVAVIAPVGRPRVLHQPVWF